MLDLLSTFLLQPPQPIDDRFLRELKGVAIKFGDDRRIVQREHEIACTNRCDIACAGVRRVTSGLVRWRVSCTGQSFAIGVIDTRRMTDFKKDKTMDWPFVRAGFGSGLGLVKSNGQFSVASEVDWSNGSYGSSYVACATEDRHLDFESDATDFAVVLDMDRLRVSFEADGVQIPGAFIDRVDSKGEFRFITSLPCRGSQAMIIH